MTDPAATVVNYLHGHMPRPRLTSPYACCNKMEGPAKKICILWMNRKNNIEYTVNTYGLRFWVFPIIYLGRIYRILVCPLFLDDEF